MSKCPSTSASLTSCLLSSPDQDLAPTELPSWRQRERYQLSANQRLGNVPSDQSEHGAVSPGLGHYSQNYFEQTIVVKETSPSRQLEQR